jgi:hypothetical protein
MRCDIRNAFNVISKQRLKRTEDVRNDFGKGVEEQRKRSEDIAFPASEAIFAGREASAPNFPPRFFNMFALYASY